MRSEHEIYNLILDVALKDDRVLAVYQNGSRTNKNISPDIFQDFDIVYVVKELDSFLEDREWIKIFGDILYMQFPDDFPGEPTSTGSYGYLMQFKDGNRIDLSIKTKELASKEILEDKLCRILLEKGKVLPSIPEATDQDYWVKKPSLKEYQACCNEFWWCTNNLAKGIWRKEVTYVMDMNNYHVRPQLERMLSWAAAYKHNYNISLGKSSKLLPRYISNEEYQEYLSTYSNADIENMKKAIIRMCEMFIRISKEVSKQLSYPYNIEEQENAYSYLCHVFNLEETAKKIY